MNLPVKSIQIEIRIKFATPKTGLIHIFIYYHVLYYHILSYIIILSYFIIYHHIYIYIYIIYSNDILSFHTKHSHFVVYLHVHHFHPFSLSPPLRHQDTARTFPQANTVLARVLVIDKHFPMIPLTHRETPQKCTRNGCRIGKPWLPVCGKLWQFANWKNQTFFIGKSW